MITSNVRELNINDLRPYDGGASHILTELFSGLWRKIEFDPDVVIPMATNVLTVVDNKIVATPKGGGASGDVELTGAILGMGPLGSPVLTSLSPNIDIDVDTQTFDLNSTQDSSFVYAIQDAGVTTFSERVTKGTDFLEETVDLSSDPSFTLTTHESNSSLWVIPQDISDSSTIFKDGTDLSSGSSGVAFSIWEEGNTEINVSLYDANNNSWSTPETINIVAFGGEDPKIDSNSSDNALAVWRRDDALVISASDYNPGTQTWSTVTDLSTINSIEPDVTINESGNGIAIWIFINGSQDQLFYSTFNGTSWSAASSIFPLVPFISPDHFVRIDNNGNAITTYVVVNSGTNAEVFANIYNGGTQAWGSSILISEAGEDVNSMDTDLDKTTGDAVAVWSADIAGADIIQYSFYDESAQSWSANTTLFNLFDSFLPSVSINSQGNAVAAWVSIDGAESKIFVSVSTGTTWATPVQIDSLNQNSYDQVVAKINENNEATLVIRKNDGPGNESLVSTFYDPNTQQWSDVVGITDISTDFTEEKLIYNNDRFISTWRETDPSSNNTIQGSNSTSVDFLFSVKKGNINAGFNRIQDVATPINPSDAANKNYVDNQTVFLQSRMESLINEKLGIRSKKKNDIQKNKKEVKENKVLRKRNRLKKKLFKKKKTF